MKLLERLNIDIPKLIFRGMTPLITTLVFFCFSMQVRGQGGPPMLTDDPGTVDKGHFEINSGIVAEHTYSESSFEFPFIDVNYGVSSHQHINVEVPLVSRYVKGDGTLRGVGKLGIGTKFRFADQDKLGIDISTHPAASFVLSNSAVHKGVVEAGSEFFIPIEFQKSFSKNIMGIELGRLISTKFQNLWTYGLLYAREFNPHINAAIEINGNTGSKLSETTLFLNIGARMAIAQRLKILLSGGKSIVIPKGNENIYIGYLALQVAI